MLKTLLTLLHVSLGIHALSFCYKLNKITFIPEITKYSASTLIRYLSFNMASVYSKISAAYGIWNLVLAMLWITVLPNNPVTVGMYVLWPSLCVLFSTVPTGIDRQNAVQVKVSKLGGTK